MKSEREKAKEVNKILETKFDTLCSNVSNTHVHWNQCLANVLHLKNELLKHQVPPALLMKLTMGFSELYRSQADMMSPVQELVRLVNVYKGSLEDKSIALKRIDEENERRKADLYIAVKKLEHSYSMEKQWRRDRTLNNWERMFCKAALNSTHGRRWKFVISKVRQRAELGLSVFNPLIDDFTEEEKSARTLIAHRITYGSTIASSPTKQSVLTTLTNPSIFSNKPSTSTSLKQSSLMSSSLKFDTSTAGEEDDDEDTTSEIESPLVSTALSRRTRSPASQHKVRSPVPVRKKSVHDIAVSTEDPEYDKLLIVQVYQPIGLKLPYDDISCTLSLLGQRNDSDILDNPDDLSYEELQFLFEGHQYRNLGCKRGTELNDIMEEEISDQLEITVHSGEDRKIFALASIPLEDISDTVPTVNPTTHPDDMVPKPFPIYALEGDVSTPCGYLPIFCVWELRERLKQVDVAVETDMFELEDDDDVVLHITPTSPALSRKSVSVMIPTPKPASEHVTPEPAVVDAVAETQYTNKKELAEMAIAHAEEMEKLQCEYEMRLESMARALEMLRAEQSDSMYGKTPHTLLDQELSETPISCFSVNTTARSRPSSTNEPQAPPTAVPRVSIKPRAVTTEPTRKKRTKWRDDLPLDFFERMEYFAQTSLSRHHNLIMRVREEVKAQAEGAMATQYWLSREVKSADSGITEDVSLPAIFMPNKTGVVYSPKARTYFHPPRSKEHRLTQPPSVFRLPNMGPVPVLNLFELSRQDVVQKGPGWLYKTCRDVTKK